MKRKTRFITLLLCFVMVAVMLPSGALAAGPVEIDRTVTFTILYKDGNTAIPGASFDIYRCADVDESGRLTVTDAFASYPINYDGLDQDGWQELATTLKGYAQRDNLSVAVSGKTDRNGELSFTLRPGLYLVVGSRHTIGDYTYTPAPFMVFLPGINEAENTWDYNVTASVKFTKKYNPPDNPPDIPPDDPPNDPPEPPPDNPPDNPPDDPPETPPENPPETPPENPPETPPENPPDDVIIRKVLKIWDDYGYEYARPEEITVQLLRDGTVYDTQTLHAGNNWRCTWDNLSDKYEWTIVEKELDGYYTKVVQEGVTFTITNEYDIPLVTEDPPVAKRITGDKPSASSPFTFILKATDPSFPMPAGSTGTTKEVSITGTGSTEFGPIAFTKPGIYTYTVSEKNTWVEGYTYDTTVYTIRYTVTEKDGNLYTQRFITDTNGNEVESPVFTNKYEEPVPTEPKLPQTGMTWWPVPLLLCLGLGFYVVGFLSRRRQRDDE